MSPEPHTNDDPLLGNSMSGLLDCALGTRLPSSPAPMWQPPEPARLAALLPQYEISRMIGRGGMGAVYQGVQRSLNRPVAVKLLPVELSRDAQFIARFQREAQTLARLSHQGVVTIFEFGQTSEGHLYFVMEFIDGTDLAHLLRTQKLEPAQALELTIQVCEALHFAHSQGVVHRDIKPANVLVTRDGRAKLADFGLARPFITDRTQLTGSHMVMGTPDYMAPEQWSGQADHRADIYALGVMLYEMLTGTRPQGAFDLPSVKARVDARLDEVILKAMRQEPDRRYQNVSELRADVDRIRTTRPPQPMAMPKARAPQPRAVPTPPKRRQGFEAMMWIVLSLLVVGIAFAGFTLFNKPVTKTKPADQPETPVATTPVIAPPAASPSPVKAEPSPVAIITPAPSTTPREPAPTPSPPVVQSPPPATLSKLDILSKEAVNAINWSLAPLEDTVPTDIRQNLTLLREDIVDEGKAKPTASIDAYRAAFFLCDAILSALTERDTARVAAGYRNAQAAANQTNTSQALEARRNYQMSWPQYAREQAQRSELQRQTGNQVAVAGEAQKVGWNQRSQALRRNLDTLYAKLRAAMR